MANRYGSDAEPPRRIPGTYSHLPIEAWEDNHPRLVETIRQDVPALTRSDIAKVLSIALGACSYCHDTFGTCHCWRPVADPAEESFAKIAAWGSSLGVDLSTTIRLVREALAGNAGAPPVRRPIGLDEGRFAVPDDFDAPPPEIDENRKSNE